MTSSKLIADPRWRWIPDLEDQATGYSILSMLTKGFRMTKWELLGGDSLFEIWIHPPCPDVPRPVSCRGASIAKAAVEALLIEWGLT